MSGRSAAGRGRGRGRAATQHKLTAKEELVGRMVEVKYGGRWYTGLVTGFYRKDNLHQLVFREYPEDFEEAKVIGAFLTQASFELEGGMTLKWRRQSEDLVTSQDVRSFLKLEVEEKGKSDLWGKGVKVDWGEDGLFVGVAVNCKRLTMPKNGQDEKQKQKCLAWEIMYADEDTEWGVFLNNRTCLRLEDGVRRRVLWFGGDGEHQLPQKPKVNLVARKSTGDNEDQAATLCLGSPKHRGLQGQSNAPSEEQTLSLKPPSYKSVKPTLGLGGQPSGNVGTGVVLSSPEGPQAPTHGNKSHGVKPDGGKQGTRGVKRTNNSLDSEDGAGAQEPCGPDGGPFQVKKKRSSLRAKAALEKESPKSGPEDDAIVESLPLLQPKKRGRLRKLSEITTGGEKALHTEGGTRQMPSGIQEDTTEHDVPQGREGGLSRGGSSRGRGGRGHIRAVRKTKCLPGTINQKTSDNSLLQSVSRLANPAKDLAEDAPPMAEGKRGPSRKGRAMAGTRLSIRTRSDPAAQNNEQEPSVAGSGPMEGVEMTETQGNMSGDPQGSGRPSLEATKDASNGASLATPKGGPQGRVSGAAANPSHDVKPDPKSLTEVRNPPGESSVPPGPSTTICRKHTVEEFKARLLGTRIKREPTTTKSYLGGLSDIDIGQHLVIVDFEQALDALIEASRPSRDKIMTCTTISMEGAKYKGVPQKIVRAMVDAMQKERVIEKRIITFYLMDSILRSSEKNPAALKHYPTLISSALNNIITMLSGELETYVKLCKVLNMWESCNRIPEKVMEMAKGKVEQLRYTFDEHPNLVEKRCQGYFVQSFELEGPITVSAALVNPYGSMGKNDSAMEALGLLPEKMDLGPPKSAWADLRGKLEILSEAAEAAASRDPRSSVPAGLETVLKAEGSTPPEANPAPPPPFIHHMVRDGFVGVLRMMDDPALQQPAGVLPALKVEEPSPDPFDQCETMRVEIPSGPRQHDFKPIHNPPPGFGGQDTDTDLNRWMVLNNERELNRAMDEGTSAQFEAAAHQVPPPAPVESGPIPEPEDVKPPVCHQGTGDEQASEEMDVDMDMDNDIGDPQNPPSIQPPPQCDANNPPPPPLPPCPHPDDVWPPLPKSPAEDFPDKAPLPPEPYPGTPRTLGSPTPSLLLNCAPYDYSARGQVVTWDTNGTQYEPPPPPDHGMYSGAGSFSARGAYRDVPYEDSLPPGYESMKMDPGPGPSFPPE